MTRVCRMVLAASITIAIHALLSVDTAYSSCKVVVNELIYSTTAQAELYNLDSAPAVVTGWRITVDDRCFVIADTLSIPPGGYRVVPLAEDVGPGAGMETSLVDIADRPHDRVKNGQIGGAPMPGNGIGWSMARAPDAAESITLFPDNDALYWTVDFNPTPGQSNNAPVPTLDGFITINEIDPKQSDPDHDRVELYNPGITPVDLTGWFLFLPGGQIASIPAITISPDDFVVVDLDSALDLDTDRNLYLFDAGGVRVDQIGWNGAPALGPLDCLGRPTDGAGPHDGFDFSNSGLAVLTCSIGCSNDTTSLCALTLHGDGTYESSHAWGGFSNTPRDVGAFAERFDELGQVCSAVFDLTRTAGQSGLGNMDVLVWEDQGGSPGAVLYLRSGINPGAIDVWPSVSRHTVPMAHCNRTGPWWLGYWGSWGSGPAAWSIAIDTNGPPGISKTKVALGLPYPPGWQDLSLVVPSARALGIGANMRAESVVERTRCQLPEGDCTWLFADECIRRNGWLLAGNEPCPPHVDAKRLSAGACCFFDGSCVQLTRTDCTQSCGDFLGDDTFCTPNPCAFQIVSKDPVSNEGNVEFDPVLWIEFSAPVLLADVTPQNFRMRGVVSGAPSEQVTRAFGSNFVTVAPQFESGRNFQAGDMIECLISGQVRSEATGLPLRATHTWQFRLGTNRGAGFDGDSWLRFSTPPNPVAVVAGDLNRDGWIDLVSCGTNGHVALFQNTSATRGSISFARKTHAFGSEDGGLSSVLLMDLDGDMDDDIVLADQEFDVLHIGRNLGDTDSIRVSWGESWPAPGGPQRLGKGDFDNDGIVDVLYPTEDSTLVVVQLLDSVGAPTSRVPVHVPGNPFDSAVSDLGGEHGLDGDLDVVLLHDLPPRFSVVHNLGWVTPPDSVLRLACSEEIGPAKGLLVENVMDVNDEQPLPDIIIASGDGSLLVYKMRETGLPDVVPLSFPTGLPTTRGLAALDADGDGDMDLVVTSATSSTWTLMTNNNGSLLAGTPMTADNIPVLPLCADLDRDNVIDVVLPCKGANLIDIWRNTPDLSAVPQPSVGGDGPPLFVRPNPFQGTVQFTLSRFTESDLRIYDIQGRLVRSEHWAIAPPSWAWDGRDAVGRSVPSGIYTLELKQDGASQRIRVVRTE